VNPSDEHIPDERALEEELRCSLAVPAPRREFQDSLRRAFVAAGAPAGPKPVRPQPMRTVLRLVVGGLAAAALILILARLFPETTSWKALDIEGEVITIDGRTVRVADLPDAGAAIMAADLVETGETRISLVLEDLYRLDVAPGSRFRPEPLVRPAAGATPRLDLEEGEIFFCKNPEVADIACTVGTPDVDVDLTGTVVGVRCDGEGTSLMVEKGSAWVSCCEQFVESGHSHRTPRQEPCPLGLEGARMCGPCTPDEAYECRLRRVAEGSGCPKAGTDCCPANER